MNNVYLCQCRDGFITLPDGSCPDRDECLGQPCLSKFGNCTNTPGSYRCDCIHGYRGDGITTCENIDECKLHFPTCGPRSTLCQDEIDDTFYICSCRSGFDEINTSP
ncbi:hypothetical protein, partial [Salmonella sp. s51228]|uniref:hypothetical protein n=1 Tax=Salmonella sp. s51228 TaxID=3159652 RepID=UPI00398074E3